MNGASVASCVWLSSVRTMSFVTVNMATLLRALKLWQLMTMAPMVPVLLVLSTAAVRTQLVTDGRGWARITHMSRAALSLVVMVIVVLC